MSEASVVTAAAELKGQQRTTVVSIITASSLMVLMLGVGLAASSLGLISTGIESTGDVVAAVVTFFAVRLGARPADESHPFGHRRAENLSALAEASILLGGGLLVVIEAIQRLIGGDSSLSAGWYVFAVISLAIVVNVARALLAYRGAHRYGSAALRSNSFHFASDVGGSVAVLVGLITVRAGFRYGDAISALIVAGFIFTAAGRLIFENAQALMDTAPADAQARARDAILTLSPEVELDRLRLGLTPATGRRRSVIVTQSPLILRARSRIAEHGGSVTAEPLRARHPSLFSEDPSDVDSPGKAGTTRAVTPAQSTDALPSCPCASPAPGTSNPGRLLHC